MCPVSPWCTHTHTHTHTYVRTSAQTFAFRRAIVGKASRAIATRNFSVFGRAFAFAVTAAVVCLARVRR